MATPLCGSLITSRRSFLALAWTLTTLLSFFSFGVSVFLGAKITSQYNSMQTGDYAEWYQSEYNYNNGCNRYLSSNDNSGDENNQEDDRDGEGEEEDRERNGCNSHDNAGLDGDFFESLATKNSRGLVFAGVYTTALGIALSLYGSTVVVGFMSLKGEYIAPCFSFRNMSVIGGEETTNDEDSTTGPKKLWGEKIHRGIFFGSIVFYTNLLLMSAVLFGEVQVYDNYNNYDEQKHNNLFSYRIEKISSVFAITCIVLAFFYILFAVIYATCGGMSDDNDAQLDASAKQHGWDQHRQYEMSSPQNGRGHRCRNQGRRSILNAMDKQEPLVGAGRHPGGITDNEGFITDMVSQSSGSSLGSQRWERGQFELS